MKRKILLLLLIFSFSALCFPQQDIPHGVELSNAIFKLCEKSNAKPEIQNLVLNGKTVFPYNIYVSFPAENNVKNNIENLRDTLLLIISQEDAYKSPEILTSLLSKLSAEKHNFDIKIILSFADSQELSKDNAIQGSIAFLSSIDNYTKYSCVIFSFESEKSKIISGCGGIVSPTWFVRNVYSSFIQNNLLEKHDENYISFIYSLDIFDELIQKAYLESEIPCIKAYFAKDVPCETISKSIFDIIDCYDYKETGETSSHSMMYTIFSKQFWMDEGLIIKAILTSVFLTLLILFSYGFINSSFKFVAWKRIKEIWHYPFSFYALSLLIIFITSRFIYFLQTNLKIPISISESLTFTLPLSFITISTTFLFALRFRPNFKKKTIDHLILITAIVNLMIFCLIDISLHPIFAFCFIFSLISIILSNEISHFLVCFCQKCHSCLLYCNFSITQLLQI